MNNQVRTWVGLAIIILGLSLPTVEKLLTPLEPSIREIMGVEKPSSEMVKSSLLLNEVVTKQKDKESFSMFNKEFSDRVVNYDTKGQNILNVYSSAAKDVFGDSLKKEYEDKIGVIVNEAMKEIMGEYEIVVTEEQRKVLSEKFRAYAWVLGGESNE